MVSNSNIRIHGAAESSFSEERLVDTPDLCYAVFSVPSRPSCIGILRDRLMSSFDEFGITTDLGSMQTCMALEEALANAFYHGNLELDSALKEDGSDHFAKLAIERSRKSPWQDRRVTVAELATPFGIWITIRDEGSGFNIAAALKNTEESVNILASGRGLVMMKAFTDELVYNDIGNEVTLVVYHNRNEDIAKLLTERAKSKCLNDRHRSTL